MNQIRPEFFGHDGLVVEDPLAAAGPSPEVDVDGLARLFTEPGLSGEFSPSSYWRGAEMMWKPPERGSAVASELTARFTQVVAELCGDHETVAIHVSGGLDSLAVLWHVLSLRPRRRVIAYVADLVDDFGDRAGDVVRRLFADLELASRVDCVIVDPASADVGPPWSAFGPRIDALPTMNATIAARAADAGAEVVLSGNGADELCAVPNYAVGQVIRRHGVRAGVQYLRDMRVSGLSGHASALVSRWLPATLRARTYWAVNWPQWCDPGPSPVLCDRYRPAAITWARSWVDAKIAEHAWMRATWADMDAHDAWWPRPFVPPSGRLQAGSPFCDARLVSAVTGLPLADRYAPGLPTPYQRVKGLVVGLFPTEIQALLPAVKRYYGDALATAVARPIPVPHAAAIGLLDQGALDRCTCVATRMTADAVENWLVGAVSHVGPGGIGPTWPTTPG